MDYEKDICWEPDTHEESYTGNYIKEWCLHHKDNDESEYSHIAFEVYDKYFSDDCQFKANPRAYYFLIYDGYRFSQMFPIKLVRDEDKSPRKKFA